MKIIKWPGPVKDTHILLSACFIGNSYKLVPKTLQPLVESGTNSPKAITYPCTIQNESKNTKIPTELTIETTEVQAKLLGPNYERAKTHSSCPAFLRG